jgi:predicted phosphohydrolase
LSDKLNNQLRYVIILIIAGILSLTNLAVASSEINSNRYGFNFVAAGDWGCDKKAHETLTHMQNKSPELVLALGDLSYQKSADCWFQMMSPLINKTKMAFGDHEYNFKNSSRLDEYLQKFNLTKQYYSFDYGNVHFLAMSSEVPFDKDSKQYGFVNEDLKSASENKSINGIVAYIYEMLYTSPTFHKQTDTIRDIYHPIFDKYHVDFVLQAHSHNYQRTYPIKYNDKDASNPVITNKNEGEYNNTDDGTIFAVVGTAGADLHNFTGQAPYVVEQFQRFGFLDVNITDGKIMKGTFYENRDGTDKDHFTIMK